MNIMNIIKNPVTIGIVAGLLTYLYMKWKYNQDQKINKYKNRNKKPKDINLLIPFAVFIVFWFISYAYFCNDFDDDDVVIVPKINNMEMPLNSINPMEPIPVYKLKKEISETSDPTEFNLVSNGIHIPKQLPDILFEMY